MSFSPDPKIQQIAEAYSLDAVDFFEANFSIVLDWTDASISNVEEVMAQFHEQLEASKPSDDTIWNFAKMFGSYVGEVYRKNHGGTWGMLEMDGDSFPAMEGDNGSAFWPWGRAQNRLVEGPADNVWHYYQHLIEPKDE